MFKDIRCKNFPIIYMSNAQHKILISQKKTPNDKIFLLKMSGDDLMGRWKDLLNLLEKKKRIK